MIKEKFVDIINGSGGPNNNSIPVYSDNKAPSGGQVYGANGKQLMLENSAESGVHYVIVDPTLITLEENSRSKFLTYKLNGKVNYIKLWILNEDTGHGYDYSPGIEMWVEYSHLAPYQPAPPQKLHKLLVEEESPEVWKVTEVT